MLLKFTKRKFNNVLLSFGIVCGSVIFSPLYAKDLNLHDQRNTLNGITHSNSKTIPGLRTAENNVVGADVIENRVSAKDPKDPLKNIPSFVVGGEIETEALNTSVEFVSSVSHVDLNEVAENLVLSQAVLRSGKTAISKATLSDQEQVFSHCLSLSEKDKKEIEQAMHKKIVEKDLCLSHTESQSQNIFLSKKYSFVIDRIVEKFKISPETTALIVRTSHEEAQKRSLDPLLVLSVIATESNFNPKAKNKSGALGLMQAIPRWHHDKMAKLNIRHHQLFNIKENIMLGTSILKEYLRLSKGNIRSALQRYNGNTKDKSQRYSNKVYKYYRWLSK